MSVFYLSSSGLAARCEYSRPSCTTTGVMSDCDTHSNKGLNVLRESVASVQPRRMPALPRLRVQCLIAEYYYSFLALRYETLARGSEERKGRAPLLSPADGVKGGAAATIRAASAGWYSPAVGLFQ